MQPAPIPANEDSRLAALLKLGLLDTEPEARFDHITIAATERLRVPISTISLLDKNREFYKSCQGTIAKQGDRDVSFCGHAMLVKYVFIVEDTLLDPRFADNPMVIGEPHIRFYAGMALRERVSGLPVGVFCIKDTKPRVMTADEVAIFMELAKQAEDELNANSSVVS
jgi:GAF domain-containing protein